MAATWLPRPCNILEVAMRPRLEFLSSGPAVSELQNLLNSILVQALPKLVVDGKFGQKTLQRVRMYQQSRGLAADGVVGRMTWAALDGKAPPKPGASVQPPAIGAKVKGISGGCSIKCSFGSAKASLKLTGPARPACIADCKPYANIPPFGLCRSMANPVVSSLTMAAQAAQAQSGKPGAAQIVPGACMPVLATGWTPAAQFELVQNLPTIDKNSILMCVYGGVITIG
jgi:hypothetical protein